MGEARSFRHCASPCGFELLPHLRVGNLLVPGEDIRKAPHVAGALHIVLAPERVYPATRVPDVPGQHLEICTGPDIVHADRVLSDPHRKKERT